MLKQAIELSGVTNARELGGYAAGGKRIRKGVLLRTGGLSGASPEALEKLREVYRVRSVIDFRMTGECEADPDPVIGGEENLRLPVIETEDVAVPGGADSLYKAAMADRAAVFETAYNAGIIRVGAYDLFLLGQRGKAAYRRFFEILLKADPDSGAVLWHCTDGKDRTGCGAMLLLSALGAERETVTEDYLLTNEYNSAVLEAVRRKVSGLPMPPEKLDALIFISGGVAESYIRHAFDTLDAHYDSVEGYLSRELGIGAEERAELQRKYLE